MKNEAKIEVQTGGRRLIQGTVLSNKMQKTVVVETSTLTKHPKYGKFVKKFKKLKAHDESSQCGVGDRVELIESRPISKEKKFRVARIIEKARRAELIDDGDTAAGSKA